MAILKSIQVTQVDNELIGLAVPSGGSSSTELFHFKLGGGIELASVNYTVPNLNILPKGDYTLFLIGINWGGPANFDVTVNFETGPAKVLKFASANPGVGLVFTPAGVPFAI
jgi:hypothetical protein